MKIYAVVAPNGQQAWASSEAGASKVATMMVKSGFGKRAAMEIAEHDVPTKKADLVSWLCIHARLNSAKGTPGDMTASVTEAAPEPEA